jgi:hypothetical protein
MTRRDRALYVLAFRRARNAMRRELQALAAEFDGEIGDLRDELHAARRQLDHLRALDVTLEAEDCDRHGCALH